jgi:hypothetical protein
MAEHYFFVSDLLCVKGIFVHISLVQYVYMLANNYLLIALHSKFRAMYYKIYIHLKTVHALHIMVIHASEPNVSYLDLINSLVTYSTLK